MPGAATHTHAESPTTQVSPIALPDIGKTSADGNLPFSRASTSSPYGIITGRSSPICHCGRRTRTARGGGSFTSVACGAVAAVASAGPASRRECRSRRGRRNLSRPCSRSRFRHCSSLLRLMPAGKPYCQCHDYCPEHNGTRQPQKVPVREFQPAKYTRRLWPGKLSPHIIRQHSVKRLNPPCRILLCDSIHYFDSRALKINSHQASRNLKQGMRQLWSLVFGRLPKVVSPAETRLAATADLIQQSSSLNNFQSFDCRRARQERDLKSFRKI